MKRRLLYSVMISLMILTSCQDSGSKDTPDALPPNQPTAAPLIPVNYDFKNLNIHLNTSIKDTASNIEWQWDHMGASGPVPDSVGEDSYMNLEQESFFFHELESLPVLGVKTNSNKIREFSVTTIFTLEDTTAQDVREVLNELNKYDLLKDEEIKNQLIKSRQYRRSDEHVSEELNLEFSDTKGGHSRLTYTIVTN